MKRHHTKEKGDYGVLRAKVSLHEQGFMILNPETEHSPFDLVGYKNKTFLRFQVKFRSLSKNGTVSLQSSTTSSSKRGYRTNPYDLNEIDYFIVFCPDTDVCYYVPSKLLDGKTEISLRVVEAKNNQMVGVIKASDFLVINDSCQ